MSRGTSLCVAHANSAQYVLDPGSSDMFHDASKELLHTNELAEPRLSVKEEAGDRKNQW